MKRCIVAVLVTVAVAGPGLALAQGVRWRGSQGWGPGKHYNHLYDPKSVETLTGQVMSVNKITPIRGMSYGVELVVKTDKETVPVHLGPGWFVENQDMKIVANDKVEVEGARVTFDGKPAVIARSVKKDDGVLVLRDDAGVPMWAGWRHQTTAPK